VEGGTKASATEAPRAAAMAVAARKTAQRTAGGFATPWREMSILSEKT